MVSRPPLAEKFDLQPHPEGGWFRETFRSATTFRPEGYAGERSTATAILFLLQPGERSAWHVVGSDELWFWHSGGPLRLRLGGAANDPMGGPADDAVLDDAVLLGPDLPQALVPAGYWQSAEPVGPEPVLVSCVVSPGFDFADFRLHAPA